MQLMLTLLVLFTSWAMADTAARPKCPPGATCVHRCPTYKSGTFRYKAEYNCNFRPEPGQQACNDVIGWYESPAYKNVQINVKENTIQKQCKEHFKAGGATAPIDKVNQACNRFFRGCEWESTGPRIRRAPPYTAEEVAASAPQADTNGLEFSLLTKVFVVGFLSSGLGFAVAQYTRPEKRKGFVELPQV